MTLIRHARDRARVAAALNRPAAPDEAEIAMRRPMNPLDGIMHAVNERLHSAGHPGFETQTLVWLDERIDGDRLQTALSRLSRCYPIMTSRLIQTGVRRPFWRPRPGADAELHTIPLDSSDDTDVLAQVARLLSAPHDLEQTDPIQFFLLRIPDGRDLFVMQYSHELMDNGAALPVLQRIQRLCECSADAGQAVPGEYADRMAEYLDRFSRRRRVRAAWRCASHRLRVLRYRAVRLGQSRSELRPAQCRIIMQELDADRTRALLSRVAEVCRFPAVSMALLASIFRGLDRTAPREQGGSRNYVAGIGLDLGLRDETGPIFQNLASIVPVLARPEDLGDQQSLIRKLNQQFRECLEQDRDLGLLELVRLFRSFRRISRRVVGRTVQDGYSIWYAYFGSTDLAGDRFCGSRVSRILFTGPSWPPIGITVVANQFRGRLCFQATYLPELIPDERASRFLDEIIDDLISL